MSKAMVEKIGEPKEEFKKDFSQITLFFIKQSSAKDTMTHAAFKKKIINTLQLFKNNVSRYKDNLEKNSLSNAVIYILGNLDKLGLLSSKTLSEWINFLFKIDNNAVQKNNNLANDIYNFWIQLHEKINLNYELEITFLSFLKLYDFKYDLIAYLCSNNDLSYAEIEKYFSSKILKVDRTKFDYELALNIIQWEYLSAVNIERLFWIYEKLDVSSKSDSEKENLSYIFADCLSKIGSSDKFQINHVHKVDFDIFIKLSSGLLALDKYKKNSPIVEILSILQNIKINQDKTNNFLSFCEKALTEIKHLKNDFLIFSGYSKLLETLFVHSIDHKVFPLMLQTIDHAPKDNKFFIKRLPLDFIKLVEREYQFTIEDIAGFYNFLKNNKSNLEAIIKDLGCEEAYKSLEDENESSEQISTNILTFSNIFYNILIAVNRCNLTFTEKLPDWVLVCFKEILINDVPYGRCLDLILKLFVNTHPADDFLEIILSNEFQYNESQFYMILILVNKIYQNNSSLSKTTTENELLKDSERKTLVYTQEKEDFIPESTQQVGSIVGPENLSTLESIYNKLLVVAQNSNLDKFFHANFVNFFLVDKKLLSIDFSQKLNDYFFAYTELQKTEVNLNLKSPRFTNNPNHLLQNAKFLIVSLKQGKFYNYYDFKEHISFYKKLLSFYEEILAFNYDASGNPDFDAKINNLVDICNQDFINLEKALELFAEIIDNIKDFKNSEREEKLIQKDQKKSIKLNLQLEAELFKWTKKNKTELFKSCHELIEFFTKAEGSDIANQLEFQRLKFNYFLYQNNYIEAEKLLKYMYNDDDESIAKNEDYASFYYAQYKISNCLPYLESLLQKSGKNILKLIRLTKWQSCCYYILGNYQAAIDTIDRLIKIGENTKFYNRCILLKIELLDKLKENEKSNELKKDSRLELSVGKNNINQVCYSLLSDKKYDEAFEFLKDNENFFSDLALCILYTRFYIAQKNYINAYECINRAIDDIGGLPQLKSLEGFVLYCLNQYEQSLNIYNKLYASEKFPNYQLFIAYNYCLKRNDKWREAFEDLIKVFPDYKTGYLAFIKACKLHDDTAKLQELVINFKKIIGDNSYWQAKLNEIIDVKGFAEEDPFKESFNSTMDLDNYNNAQIIDNYNNPQTNKDIFLENLISLVGEEVFYNQKTPFSIFKPLSLHHRRIEYSLFNKNLISKNIQALDLCSDEKILNCLY